MSRWALIRQFVGLVGYGSIHKVEWAEGSHDFQLQPTMANGTLRLSPRRPEMRRFCLGRRVVTDTDGESSSSSYRLYESMGMEIFRCENLCEKELRPDKELRFPDAQH